MACFMLILVTLLSFLCILYKFIVINYITAVIGGTVMIYFLIRIHHVKDNYFCDLK